MLRSRLCALSKVKKVTAVVISFILIDVVFYSFYKHEQFPAFKTNLNNNDGRFNVSYSDFFTSAKKDSIEAHREELGIPNAKWMHNPIVNPFPYAFILNPKNVCLNKTVELLISVPVARSNFGKRQTIRETWGSYSRIPANNALLLFFMGNGSETESPDIQKKINEESKLHADIAQCDFSDTYRNLSLKSMSVLRWVDAFCPHATFLTKADDDMYIYVPKLVERLREMKKKHERNLFIIGRQIRGAKPVQNKLSKWYTPLDRFPEKVYPTYESGCSYSMTGIASRFLYQAALRTPLFWLEDIYITGLCARMANISILNDQAHTYNKPKASGCSFNKFITGHRYSEVEIRNIHHEIFDKNLTCP